MLYLMRKHAQSWLIKVALGAIIVVFVFWYGYNYKAQRGNRVAVVNGAPIVVEEYRNAYDQLLETYRRQFGNTLDDELIKSLNLKQQALDQIINQRLLFQEASRLDFRVTNEELLSAIQRVSAFQRDGRFDPQVYRRLLSMNRMSPEIYEEMRKNELLIEKLQGFILGSVKVSEAEALEMFTWLEEKVSIDYVLFKPEASGEIVVTPEELKAYFEEHKEAYEVPPKVNVKYLRIDFKGFDGQAEVTEEEVQTHFDLNRESYGTPKQVRARHILFRTEPDAKQEAVEAGRKKALEVLKEARAGKDFAELAKTHSDDKGSAENGGDLGFFPRERMVKAFSDAAFAMKAGEISEPVKTPFGWHLIKVEEVKEAKDPVLGEVAEQIRTKLKKDAARSLAFDRSEEIYDACYQVGNIADVAAGHELEVHETGFFSANESVKGVKEGQRFAEFAFALPEDDVSEPLELSDGYYILERLAEEPARIPELETVTDQVREDFVQARKDELAKQEAEAFLNDVKGGETFEGAAASRKMTPESTDLFDRSGTIPSIGFEKEIQEAAFSLTPSKPFPDQVIRGRQGYYVIQFKARQEPDLAGFEGKKGEITSSIMAQKRQRAFDEFLAQLRDKSEITIQEGFLN